MIKRTMMMVVTVQQQQPCQQDQRVNSRKYEQHQNNIPLEMWEGVNDH